MPSLPQRFAPPYSLSTTILVASTVVVAMLAGFYSVLAYQRLASQTLASAEQWADSVAQLASTANASALVLNDVAAIESNLLQIARLPGIDNIAVFRADGRVFSEALKSGSAVRSVIGGSSRMEPPPVGTTQLPAKLEKDYYESWAYMDAANAGATGWVRVQFSLSERSQELNKLWHQSLLTVAVLVGVVLFALHFIIGYVLGPIRALSRFAKKMPEHIGSQLKLKEGCIEVNQLGQALNHASMGIADQLGRIQGILNTATEAIIGLDAQGNVATVNPAAVSFFGRPNEVLLRHPIELCVPGLNTRALHEMFEDSTSYYFGMTRIVRKDFFGTRQDGTLFPVEISFGQIKDNASLRYVCIVRDVTDERAALEFTELYERALACSHNAVFIANAKLDMQPMVYVNEALLKVMELPIHKILGSSMNQFFGAATDDATREELALAVQERRNANVTLHKTLPNGKNQVTELSLSPVNSDKGQLTHFVGIVSDVSARVQAEEAMAQRRAQLDAIFSLSPDGFVLFDSDNRMVFANPAFERMTGLSWTDHGQPVSLDDFETVMSEVCDAKQPFPSINADGREGAPWQARLHLIRPQVRVVLAQARTNNAGSRETILYFRDVTHEDAVDRMKSEFLAAAAHELRTPMVSIFGFTELLLRRKFSEERQTDMLQTIHRQSGLLVKMINELLDLARIESRGGLDLKIEAHPLVELVNNSVKGLMLKDTDRQVEIGDLPQVNVQIDPEKMQLAMNNLLSNAFKYSPQGGTVSVAARLSAGNGERFAIIEVRDQGIGMTPEQLARVFERFYRADASGNIPGTGLGLSMVKEVAGLHKGRIEITSEYGKGTMASLWIPLAKTPLPIAATVDPASTS